ncbi:hypothetical protein ACRALDRAFT_210838 [Sodiomyces alcalophilus JCM 7366]|uniref:uncharacterized protein n=1 Tax=Sodiomyces alcalophilus JCM 7366 TaxID=591952 RepID=UPI0039B5B6B8
MVVQLVIYHKSLHWTPSAAGRASDDLHDAFVGQYLESVWQGVINVDQRQHHVSSLQLKNCNILELHVVPREPVTMRPGQELPMLTPNGMRPNL